MTRQFRITVNGQAYDVQVEEMETEHSPLPNVSTTLPLVQSVVARVPVAAPAVPQAAAHAPPAPVGAGGGEYAPMSGKVVSIAVKVGQDVQEGEVLLTLEAMKMNIPVKATHSGRVGALQVAVDSVVEAGQCVLTFA